MKCQCEWIDSQGNPTPDDYPAVAQVICYDPRTFGEDGCPPFLICEKHLSKKGKFWKAIPLPGQSLAEAHKDVQWDAQTFKIIPNVVIESIKKSFPGSSDDILNSLKYNRDHFYFERWDMYVGVEEKDGFIHS